MADSRHTPCFARLFAIAQYAALFMFSAQVKGMPGGALRGGSPALGVGAYLLANSAVGGLAPFHKKWKMRLNL